MAQSNEGRTEGQDGTASVTRAMRGMTPEEELEHEHKRKRNE